MGDKTKVVHAGLEELIRTHATDADMSGIDEIVVNYVTVAIEEMAGGDEEIDVASMKDVMTAYVPDLEAVPEMAVYTWVIDMVHKLQGKNKDKQVKMSLDPLGSASPGSQKLSTASSTNEMSEMSHKLCEASGTLLKLPETSCGSEQNEYSDGIALLEMFPTACDLEVQHCLSTCEGDLEEATCLLLQRQEQQISLKSPSASKASPTLDEMVKESTYETSERFDKLSEASGTSSSLPETTLSSEQNEYADGIALLLEMFPATSNLEVQHCLSTCGGDLEEATCLILQRQEQEISIKSPEASELAMSVKPAPIPDRKMKESILNRYGFIDNEDDRREHKPVAPKWEGKKMVRYRDSNVVSHKGERYSVIKKEESEEMKKTYVNLRPWRRYRFH